MISRLIICVAWIAIGISAYAAQTKLESLAVGSMTYSNVTVLGVNASDVYFNSDHGIRNVKLRLLSPDLQSLFHYDPVAARKAEEQQAEDEKRYQDNLAAQLAADYIAARNVRETKAQGPYAAAGLADPATSNSPLGKTAPDLNMQNWIGTKPKMDGKLTIIDIWSPKSASCRKWIPVLNDMCKNFADSIAVVGVTPANLADITQMTPKVEFPCAIDSDGKFISAAKVTTFPCVMLLDAKRVIRYEGHPAALTPEILQSILKQSAEQEGEQAPTS